MDFPEALESTPPENTNINLENPRDLMSEIGVARARDIIKSIEEKGRFVHGGTANCWECNMVPTGGKDGGYISLKRATNEDIEDAQETGVALNKNAGKHYYLHRLAFIAHHGRNPKKGLVVSHLCDNRRCGRPDHHVEESQAINVGRQDCPRPGMLDDQGHLIKFSGGTTCQHQPTCFPALKPLLECPHPPGAPVYAIPEFQPLTINQWLESLEEPASLSQSQQDALDSGLYSDAPGDQDDEENLPSSPPRPPSPLPARLNRGRPPQLPPTSSSAAPAPRVVEDSQDEPSDDMDTTSD